MPNYVSESIARIREQVGRDEVILGLSGGVDSSVAAALIHKAIGEQLTCVFVDHGLLRLNEAEQVLHTSRKHMHVKVLQVNAADEFYAALAGISDPEQKRKMIGKHFVEVFQSRRPRSATRNGSPRERSIPMSSNLQAPRPRKR
jgi:GMP synthase (glutamine-hydrolysing)